MVKEINGAQLKALLDGGKTVVCDFWASWCGPCRMLAPVMDTLAEEFSSRAEFVKINVDENGDVAEQYGVMSIPNVFVLEGETVKGNSLGYVPEAAMRTFLEEHI